MRRSIATCSADGAQALFADASVGNLRRASCCFSCLTSMFSFASRRLNTLNKCVEMKLELSRSKRRVSMREQSGGDKQDI